MAAATFETIIRDLKNKVYRPVYFLFGPEPYYIDVISDYIENHVLDETEKEFNQSVLYGRDVDLLTIVSTARRFPMMSNFQVVIVKEAQDLKELSKRNNEEDEEGANSSGPVPKKKVKEEEKDPLSRYLENPLKSTILVFCYKYKSLDKRTKTSKLFEQHSMFFESKKVWPDKLADWAEQYSKSRGRKIHVDAAQLVADFIGDDLSRIANELDKLIINLRDGQEITSDDVEKYIGISKEFNPFELQKAMTARDYLKVNRIINYFGSNQKSNPIIVTISTLYVFFNKIILYHSLKAKPGTDMLKEMGVNAFFMRDFDRAARTFSLSSCVTAISLLHDFDLRSKGVNNEGTGPGDLLKELVFKIMHPEELPELTNN
jgi:DNA polymerase-3 subunit delta